MAPFRLTRIPLWRVFISYTGRRIFRENSEFLPQIIVVYKAIQVDRQKFGKQIKILVFIYYFLRYFESYSVSPVESESLDKVPKVSSMN